MAAVFDESRSKKKPGKCRNFVDKVDLKAFQDDDGDACIITPEMQMIARKAIGYSNLVKSSLGFDMDEVPTLSIIKIMNLPTKTQNLVLHDIEMTLKNKRDVVTGRTLKNRIPARSVNKMIERAENGFIKEPAKSIKISMTDDEIKLVKSIRDIALKGCNSEKNREFVGDWFGRRFGNVIGTWKYDCAAVKNMNAKYGLEKF